MTADEVIARLDQIAVMPDIDGGALRAVCLLREAVSMGAIRGIALEDSIHELDRSLTAVMLDEFRRLAEARIGK